MVRYTIKFILFYFFTALFILSGDKSFSQDSLSATNFDIRFESQWPVIDTTKQKNRKSIFDIISGRKKPKMERPVSMVINPENVAWILDQKANNIFENNKNKITLTDFIEKKKTNFTSLVGICNFTRNRFLFTDSYLNKIFVVNPYKNQCIVLNDSLKLNKPTGIAFSPVTNEIWVVETGEHRIVVLDENGNIKKIIGHRGKLRGEFNFPTHISIDKNGLAYVVDAMNFRVQVFDVDGKVISVFGSNGDATGHFASPKGIATDSYGHIYIADALFHAIQIFDIHGNYLYSFGTQGQEDGQFWMPSGLFIDSNNRIYVCDTYNSRVEVFQLLTSNK